MKFADDRALLSLLFGSQQDHSPALQNVVKWCDDSYLKFNACKTKELVIDFRKHKVLEKPPFVIQRLKL